MKMVKYKIVAYKLVNNTFKIERAEGTMKGSILDIGVVFRRHPEIMHYDKYQIVETPL